jgi:cytochrome P450
MLSDPDLISFDPPARPLAGWSGLRTFLRNFIETYPRSTYEQEVTRITTGFSDLLLVCDPALIQEVLVERSEVFGRDAMWRRALGPLFGETSLVLAEGANWRWQRRAVAPTFRHETLLSFVPTFAEIAAQQVLRWRHAPKNEPVEVGAGMSQTTFDVIVETMRGGSAALDPEGCRRALIGTLRAAQWHSLFALFSLPGWMPFPGRQRAMRANHYLHANMSRVVAVRRANPSSRSDLFELLLVARDVESARGMTDAELVTNLAAFISAGHETTAVALDVDTVVGRQECHVATTIIRRSDCGGGRRADRCRPPRSLHALPTSHSGSDAALSTGRLSVASGQSRDDARRASCQTFHLRHRSDLRPAPAHAPVGES